MLRTFLLIALAGFSIQLNAQDSNSKTRDLGVVISKVGLSDIPIDLVYKTGRDSKFWRYELIFAQGQVTLPQTVYSGSPNIGDINRAAAGFRMGRENRKPITDAFSLYHGIEFGLSGQYQSRSYFYQNSGETIKHNNYILSPKLGYSFGAIFNIKPSLYLDFQLSPAMGYNMNWEDSKSSDASNISQNYNRFSQSLDLNFTQAAVQVGLFYSFTK